MCTQSKPNLDENRLIPIKDLMELTFVIPSYQRGYRWDEQQARDLLDDLYAFMTKPKNKEIYCLQPLVVSEVTNENGASVDDKEKSKWRVVDGQQRLTTIYLLLKYLETSDEDKLFSIEYERDQETISRKDFLKNITEKGLDSAIKNVDFYHIYIVFNTIEKWFSEKAKENSGDKAFNDLKDLKKEYKDALLKDNILFLWDPIPPALETKTFTDLNSGRISLTNSELIKALFLNKNNFAGYPEDEQQSMQFKIAREWYEIENTLQNDEFWLFIHSRNYTKPTRIDFILQLMCKNDCFEILDDISKENLEALKKKPEALENRLGEIVYRKEDFNNPCFKCTEEYIKKINESSYIYLKMPENEVDQIFVDQIFDVLYEGVHGNSKKNDRKKLDNDKEEDFIENSKLGNKIADKLREDETAFSQFYDDGDGDDNYFRKLTNITMGYISNLGKEVTDREDPLVYLKQAELDLVRNGYDDYGVFRYFSEAFTRKNKDDVRWVEEDLWKKIKEYYDILLEWFNDYKLYHYIGYLVAVNRTDEVDFIGECIKLWQGSDASLAHYEEPKAILRHDKNLFADELKDEIVFRLKSDNSLSESMQKKLDRKPNFLSNLIEAHKHNTLKDINGLEKTVNDSYHISEYLIKMNFEQDKDDKKLGYSKRCCVNILLLHSIESTIQYNNKLVNNNRYTLPYFTRFPFHLYNSDRWDVEHIRPNSGDAINKEEERLLFLLLAIHYYGEEAINNLDIVLDSNDIDIKDDYNLYDVIKWYVNGTKNLTTDYDTDISNNDDLQKRDIVFQQLFDVLAAFGGEELDDADKNKIWNYTLLDSSTNREYGNHIFPYKRAYISMKEKGRKLRYGIEELDPIPSKGLKYKHTKTRDREDIIVRLLLDYNELADDAKGNALRNQIKQYINGLDHDSKLYKPKKATKASESESLYVELNDALEINERIKESIVQKYSIKYLKSKEREEHDGLQFKLTEASDETPFVLNTTRNVFTKYYSEDPTTMLHWTRSDAEKYWENMKEVLDYYFMKLDEELKPKGDNDDECE